MQCRRAPPAGIGGAPPAGIAFYAADKLKKRAEKVKKHIRIWNGRLKSDGRELKG